MNQATLVRPLTPPDIGPLASTLAPMQLFSVYALKAEDLVRKWEAALAANQAPLVAIRDGLPIGVCWFAVSGTFVTGAYLRLLAISERHQRQGIGLTLLRAYEAACSPATGGHFILANHQNVAAQQFYEAAGYAKVGSLPDFIKPGVSEFIYWKASVALASTQNAATVQT